MSDAEQTYYEVILSVPSAMYFECLILDYQLYDDLTVISIYMYMLAFFFKNLFHRRDHGLVDLFSLIA